MDEPLLEDLTEIVQRAGMMVSPQPYNEFRTWCCGVFVLCVDGLLGHVERKGSVFLAPSYDPKNAQ